MTEDTDPVADGLRRALQAAELANDAAEDVSRLGKVHHAFSERMIAAQKRTTALAGGALVGSVVALGLASLVYFRSVADLREAADLQAEAAKLIVEQVMAMKEANESSDVRFAGMETKLDEVATQIVEGVEKAQAEQTPGTDLAQTIAAEVKTAEDSILAALAELDLRGPDGTVIAETLARIEAGLLRATAAPAAPKAEPVKPAKTGTTPKPAAPSKPRAAAAPEPNPFAYP